MPAAGLTISATPSALVGSVALWGLLFAVATRACRMPAWKAALGSLVAVAFHWASVLAHHAGHGAAAWSTGHPMAGVRLYAVFGSSLYPADEPALPTSLHVRRALGGPVASVVLGGALLGLFQPLRVVLRPEPKRRGTRASGSRSGFSSSAAAMRTGMIMLRSAASRPLDRSPGRSGSGRSPTHAAGTLLIAFAILDNLVVLGLGSLLPMGFTDGSTLLRLWREGAR